jgi:ABC-type phosphate transport system substrate-binding protein
VILRTPIQLALLVLAAATAGPPAAADIDVVVVASAKSRITMLSAGDIADLYLGRLTRLPDGTVAVPLDQTEGSPTREQFYREFTGKSPAQVKALWSKLIFTGRGRPPRALASDAEVLRALRENPDAIGYVRRSSVDATARILR